MLIMQQQGSSHGELNRPVPVFSMYSVHSNNTNISCACEIWASHKGVYSAFDVLRCGTTQKAVILKFNALRPSNLTK
jgi:hypothetical protein